LIHDINIFFWLLFIFIFILFFYFFIFCPTDSRAAAAADAGNVPAEPGEAGVQLPGAEETR
jgi:hypothetical protein